MKPSRPFPTGEPKPGGCCRGLREKKDHYPRAVGITSFVLAPVTVTHLYVSLNVTKKYFHSPKKKDASFAKFFSYHKKI